MKATVLSLHIILTHTCTWKSHWKQTWNKCRNTVLYKNILLCLHEMLTNADQVNSFRTQLSLIHDPVNWISFAFFIFEEKLDIIKLLEWQRWSQQSRPTLFSEIKPQLNTHTRGRVGAFKTWQIYEMWQSESDCVYVCMYMCMYVMYMCHSKLWLIHNPHVKWCQQLEHF